MPFITLITLTLEERAEGRLTDWEEAVKHRVLGCCWKYSKRLCRSVGVHRYRSVSICTELQAALANVKCTALIRCSRCPCGWLHTQDPSDAAAPSAGSQRSGTSLPWGQSAGGADSLLLEEAGTLRGRRRFLPKRQPDGERRGKEGRATQPLELSFGRGSISGQKPVLCRTTL